MLVARSVQFTSHPRFSGLQGKAKVLLEGLQPQDPRKILIRGFDQELDTVSQKGTTAIGRFRHLAELVYRIEAAFKKDAFGYEETEGRPIFERLISKTRTIAENLTLQIKNRAEQFQLLERLERESTENHYDIHPAVTDPIAEREFS